ncbi:MAG: hypothetical protein ACPGQS_03080 [Bradymonadia bacterium]
MNIHESRLSEISRQQSKGKKRTTMSFKLCLTVLFVMLIIGCHRSPFGSDQTPCPGEDGEALVLDYTLNCLYSEGVPEDGCPPFIPNEYTVSSIQICSERSGAQEPYLRRLINEFLDIDANTPTLSEETNPEALDASIEDQDDGNATSIQPTSSEAASADEEQD